MAEIYIDELDELTDLQELWWLIVNRGADSPEVKVSTRTLRQKLATAEHNTEIDYKAGMLCVKNGVVYQALVNTLGAFDPAKWKSLSAPGNRKVINSGEAVSILGRCQQFIYGNMKVNDGGTLNIETDAELVVMDGLLEADGQVNNDGAIFFIDN